MATNSDNCPCPPGYVRDQSGLNCVKTTTVAATNNGLIYTVGTGVQSGAYGQLGAAFYQDISALQYPITYTIHTPQDILKAANGYTLLVNNSIVSPLWGDGNPANGRLNNVGVWTSPPYTDPTDITFYNSGSLPPNYQWIGFSACIDVPTTGTYCIGMAADNACRFSINGQVLVEIENIGSGSGYTFPFNKWHIFPITLQAGKNIVTVEGQNYSSIGTFAAEIYRGTAAQVAAITTQAALGAITIFTTENKIGQSFQSGTNSGFSCPEGYALNTCGPTLTCTITESIVYSCCYLLTNCVTGATIVASTDLSQYIGQVVIISGQTGGWTVTTALDCTGAVAVIVTGTFPDCQSASPCFRLENCVTGAVIITSTNLSSSVGQTVNLSGTYAGCWTVTTSPNCMGAVAVTFVSTSPNCVSCLPCYILRNCLDDRQTVTTTVNLSQYVGQVVQIAGYSDICWTVSQTTGCINTTPVQIVKSFANCDACKKKCYVLVDCAGVEASIIVSNDLSASLGLIVQIKECPDVCWQVQLSTTCVGAVVQEITATFKTCELCNPPLVCPAPELLHQRKVKPGYNTPGCSIEYTEKVNCEFAGQIYNQVKKRRYGITVCCEDDYLKWLIKKQLLDLDAIWDRKLCVSCPPITCCTPCPVVPAPTPPTPVSCPAPGTITATITVTTSCADVTGAVSAAISFNNPSTNGL